MWTLNAVRLGTLAVTLGLAAFASDSSFRPQTVVRFGCAVEQVTLETYGEHNRRDVWQATAWAEHSDGGRDWSRTLAEYPVKPKMRSKAMKDCDVWMEQAEKQVKGR